MCGLRRAATEAAGGCRGDREAVRAPPPRDSTGSGGEAIREPGFGDRGECNQGRSGTKIPMNVLPVEVLN